MLEDPELSFCTYCGVPCDSVDHVVPRHILKRAEDAGIPLIATFHYSSWIVPACRECNSALGGALHPNLKARRDAAKAHIRKKYAHLLRIPDWSEDELSEVSSDTRSDIIIAIAKRDAVKARLSWKGAKNFHTVDDLLLQLSKVGMDK